MKYFAFVRCLALSLNLLCLLSWSSATAQLLYDIIWPMDGALFPQNSVGNGGFNDLIGLISHKKTRQGATQRV